ncbi:MAG: hypothetical protein KDI30_11885 [Pseudomonadales bacterium]|nr:hypothetical protein [Pseudomonadales bacterium]
MASIHVETLQQIDGILQGKQARSALRYKQIAFLLMAEPDLSYAEVGRRVGLSQKSVSVSMNRIMDSSEMRQIMALLHAQQLQNAAMSREVWLQKQQAVLAKSMETYTRDIDGKPVTLMKDTAQANKALDNLAKVLGFYRQKPETGSFTLIQHF